MQILTLTGLSRTFHWQSSVSISPNKRVTLVRNVNSLWSLGRGWQPFGSGGTPCQSKRKQGCLLEEEGLPSLEPVVPGQSDKDLLVLVPQFRALGITVPEFEIIMKKPKGEF